MRLHRIRLANYRGIAESQVSFAGDGVTVVEGPNEIGKSSIPEALNLILTELDSSGKRHVKAVRPVHRDAGAEVEVEISCGDYRFVYFKRWHKRAETTLKVTAPSPEQLTGREAHARVEQILTETMDEQLWAALSIEQGATPALPRNLANATSLGQALDQAAGGARASESDDSLWERIEAERAKYWTATGQPLATRKKSAEQIEMATERVTDLEAQRDATLDDATEVARLEADVPRLRETSHKSRGEEQELTADLEKANLLKNEVDRRVAERAAAAAQLERAQGDAQSRRLLVTALAERTEQLAALEAEAATATPTLTAAIERAESAAQALRVSKDALHSAEAAAKQAYDDRDHHRQRIEIEQLSERLQRFEEADKRLGDAEQVLAALAEVDEDSLSQIEAANESLIVAKAAASTEVASLELTAVSDLDVELDGQRQRLASGEQMNADVRERTELVLSEVAKLVVQAGAGSRDSQAEVAKARDELARLCAAAGVADLASARRALQERRDAQRDYEDAKRSVAENLRDLTPDVLLGKVRGLSQRVADYSAQRPGDVPLPATFDEAKQVASQAEAALDRCRADLTAHEQAAERAADARRSADVASATVGGKIESAREALTQASTALDEARSERTDSDLDAAVAAAQQAADAASAGLADAESELRAADPETIEAKLANARETASRAERELRDNESTRQELKGRLQAREAEGLHDQLNDAQRDLDHLQRSHDSDEAKARAAELLYRTFARHRQLAHQRYIEPLKQQIERLGRIVYGPSFEVHISDKLEVSQRTFDGKTLDVAQLSVGAREQLGLICRLACAVLVSPDGGGAPVIIDDALGWSDPERLASMGAAINAAGSDCQVIVLTCMPGRYAGVGSATVVRLAQSS